MSNLKAKLLRKVSNSTDIEKTMRSAVAILADAGIPSLVVGGYAVQENGYPRFTIDVDLVVPSVQEAKDKLSISGFRANPGSSMTVTDRASKVEVDLLPGGGSVGRGPLKLPMPTQVSKRPIIASLQQIIEIKLSSYLGNPNTRQKDVADVVELMKANNCPRDFLLAEEVREEYQRLWDGLHEEQDEI
jgi:hypothetical protein